MAYFDIFSKRHKRMAGNLIDVYQYDEISKELRIQLTYIIKDIIGSHSHDSDEIYSSIVADLAREYGVHQIGSGRFAQDILFNFIQITATASQVLDVVEVCFHYAAVKQGLLYSSSAGVKMNVGDATRELNLRLLDAGVGYQFENGEIIRVDSQFVHAEVVKPALAILADPRYAGAQEEFLKAHKHYREGDYKACLAESLKAFESTMKAICKIRNWQYKETDTAKTLIEVCLQNGLIPSMLQSQFGSLRSLLESGTPTLRNKLGGHGQGAVPTVVPTHLAAYALHLTAANIVFLATAEKVLKNTVP